MLRGKTALITGASKGIGKSIAELFAQNGAHLFLNSRNQGALEQVCSEIRTTYNVLTVPVPFDVANPEEVKNGFHEIFKSTKSLDILVNNAGVLGDALIGMITSQMIHDVFAINVFGSIYCCQYAARMMAKQKRGSIINASSIVGLYGNAGQTVYGGSKAAIIGITKSLSKELAEFNIRVNAVAAGFIDTDMTKSLLSDKYQERVESIKMKRVGYPLDVAKTVLFLASDLSSYVTGQVIGVDGGMLI